MLRRRGREERSAKGGVSVAGERRVNGGRLCGGGRNLIFLVDVKWGFAAERRSGGDVGVIIVIGGVLRSKGW